MTARLIAALGVVAMMTMAGGTPSLALTSKQKAETCKFGADNQKLTGAARKSFMAKCMSNQDSPRGQPVEQSGQKSQ
jgi:hypothetical protein